MRAPLPTPKNGALPLPASLSGSPLLEFQPGPQDLPGPGYDGSVCAPKDIWVGGETAALQRLKVHCCYGMCYCRLPSLCHVCKSALGFIPGTLRHGV